MRANMNADRKREGRFRLRLPSWRLWSWRPQTRAQGLVEFALILPLLLLVTLGIIEFGRLLVIFTSTSSAARQAARYGSVGEAYRSTIVPFYLDCAGMRRAAQSASVLTLLAGTGNIQITYQHPQAPGDFDAFGTCNAINQPVLTSGEPMTRTDVVNGDRVVVTVTTTYQPIVPLVPIPPIPFTFVAARTIFPAIVGPTPTINPALGADLEVTKTASPDPVTPGQLLTYVITVRNKGGQPAISVRVEDSLPAGVTLVSATPSQGTCSGTSPVTCDLGTLNSGSSASVTIVVTVDAARGAILYNVATALTSTPEFDMSNNTGGVNTTVAAPDLALTKTGPANASPGGQLTYVLNVTNNGNAQATGVQVVDTLPGGVTLVSATPSQGTCSGTSTVTCDLGTVDGSGGSASVTIVATAPLTGGTITNSALVTPDDDTPADNTSSWETNILTTPMPDLAVTKTASPDPVLVGGQLTYNIVVNNVGTASAATVRLDDTLPTGITAPSATPSLGTCTISGSTVTCDLGTLNSGGSASVAIQATAPQVAGTIVNTALASTPTTESNTANNSGSAPIRVVAPDLQLTKTAPGSVSVSGRLTYTLVVDNIGTAPASDVNLVDTLPTGVTFVSATPSQGTCSGTSTVTCNLGTLNNSVRATVTLVVTAPASPTTFTNNASVTTSTTEPITSNNGATATTTVTSEPDLRLTKTGRTTVEANQTLTYTLVVDNIGTAPASAVILTDTLPASVTFVSASSGCSHSGTSVICSLGTLNNGASDTILIVVTAPAVNGPFTNIADVTTSTPEPITSNNHAAWTTTVAPPPCTTVVSTTIPGADTLTIYYDFTNLASINRRLTGLTLSWNGHPNDKVKSVRFGSTQLWSGNRASPLTLSGLTSTLAPGQSELFTAKFDFSVAVDTFYLTTYWDDGSGGNICSVANVQWP